MRCFQAPCSQPTQVSLLLNSEKTPLCSSQGSGGSNKVDMNLNPMDFYNFYLLTIKCTCSGLARFGPDDSWRRGKWTGSQQLSSEAEQAGDVLTF